MSSWSKALRRACYIGALTSVTTTLTAALCGWRESHNALAPLNAVSHILWGDEATSQDRISLKYTATGVALNTAAMFSWALVFVKLFGRGQTNHTTSSLSGGALVSLLAYIVDYHVVPRRLTPGIEARLSSCSLLVIYVVLALSLAAGGLLVRQEDA